jgi:tetratricopeptide (TPR) repeat protein
VLGGVLLVTVLLTGTPTPASAVGSGGSGGLSDAPAKREDPDYTTAVKAIQAGDFATAIPLLEGVVRRDDRNADAYNWLGYAVRRSGEPARAIPIYQKALAIDPKHRGAHEYIGEAYLMLQRLPEAKQHLATLDRLCLFPCSEYRDLKRAVEAYEKNEGPTKARAATQE